MDQIGADRVQPAGPPALGEKVVFRSKINQSVYVINPPFLMLLRIQFVIFPIAGGEMELRTERLMVKRSGRWRILGSGKGRAGENSCG